MNKQAARRHERDINKDAAIDSLAIFRVYQEPISWATMFF